MSNVDMFLKAKRLISANPGWNDQEVAEALGERLSVCGQVIKTARRDLEADVMGSPSTDF